MPYGKLWGMTDTPGKRLKKAREDAGFRSARGAAIRHHWNPSTYASHENGQTSELPPKAAREYAKAFKVKAAWLNHGETDLVVAKDRVEKVFRQIPPDRQPEAIEYLEFMATRRKK